MKSEKGVTLTALVVYICVAMVIISIMALLSTHFYTNMNTIKGQDLYVVEFNKFNMFFINDVKNNKNVKNIETTKITFDDGVVYELKGTDIYRNETKIASNIQKAIFSLGEPKVIGKTTKNIVEVTLSIGGSTQSASSDFGNVQEQTKNRFNKTIEYVLKYW